MYQEKMVLCGANSYEEKYYFNEDFAALPSAIQDELKILCVLFVSEIGGILTLVFEEDGTLCFQVASEENDFFFDEIGSGLKVRQMQREHRELLEALELYYRVVFLGEKVEDLGNNTGDGQ